MTKIDLSARKAATAATLNTAQSIRIAVGLDPPTPKHPPSN